MNVYVPPGRFTEPDAESSRSPSPELAPAVAAVAAEAPISTLPADGDASPTKRWWQFGRKKQATIDKKVVAAVPADETSNLVLPTAPSDAEKISYAQTRRFVQQLLFQVYSNLIFFGQNSALFLWDDFFRQYLRWYVAVHDSEQRLLLVSV